MAHVTVVVWLSGCSEIDKLFSLELAGFGENFEIGTFETVKSWFKAVKSKTNISVSDTPNIRLQSFEILNFFTSVFKFTHVYGKVGNF